MSESPDRKPARTSRLYQLGRRLIHSKHVLWGLGLASFLESIIVPIPLETILIPLMQARRHQLLLLAGIALLGCLLGATVGYAVGYFVFEAVGQQLVEWVSTPEQFEQVRQSMETRGFWFVLSVGVIPVPFQIAMLAAGATGFPFALFLLASAISRAIRYFGLALLVWIAGNKAQALFERHKLKTMVVITLLVVLAWSMSMLGNGSP
ncbi:YqaA family protein [Marinobacter sp.]|uniref:YqaA family protein n=1 Tax=Marinobacter sp. TaxID=50741 RepID=UPI0035655EA6